MTSVAYTKIEDGLVLSSSNLNLNYSARLIKRQLVDYTVEIGDMVVYDFYTGKWIKAINTVPIGMYIGKKVIVMSGYVYNLSELVPENFYWIDKYGRITANRSLSYNNIKIGYAISESEMFLSIDPYDED